MRLIGTLLNEMEARRFTAYLKQQGIDARCEANLDTTTERFSYQLWIRDEDQITAAAEALARFQNSPSDPEFNIQIPSSPAPGAEAIGAIRPDATVQRQPALAPITYLFLFLCSLFYLISCYQAATLSSTTPPEIPLIDKQLLFDFPPSLQEPYWKGAYDYFLDRWTDRSPPQEVGFFFYRIGQGEVWRLFTPSLLHGGLLHILFNMIWLWMLGRPIEERLGWGRTLFLTLILGIGSNTCQYLMGGPFFLGYSGIVVGLAGFIWMREKIASWEGYPVHRSTLLFLALFVIAMFAIQFTSFILQTFTTVSFSPQIANTGHIAGGILGLLLGRSRFFAARVK